MSNPYVDIAFEVFNEALDEITDAKEDLRVDHDIVVTDLWLLEFEQEIIERLAGDYRVKLQEGV